MKLARSTARVSSRGLLAGLRPTVVTGSPHRGESHQPAAVGLGLAQAAGKDAAQYVGVGDLQPSVVGDGGEGDAAGRAALAEAEAALVADGELVLVAVLGAAPVLGLGQDVEAGGVLAGEQPLHLVARGWGFDPEITAQILLCGYRIYEVPISYTGREFNEGKKISWKDGFTVLGTLLKYRLEGYKPRISKA